MRIQFQVPADADYAGRVTNVLSWLYLRRYAYVGAALVVIGLVGAAVFALSGRSGSPVVSLWTAMIVAGVLSLLFVPWVQRADRRRSAGLAVEGSYDITDERVMMHSGGERHRIAWTEVTGVSEVRDFWVLFVGRTPATVIPQDFMSAEERQTLQAFLIARAGKGADQPPAG
jgi:hypothetical protein